MIFRFAQMRSSAVPVLGLTAFLSASVLAGCLGGDLDTSTVQPVPKDTVAVIAPPPKDTSHAHDSVIVIAAVHSIYPRLKIGEKWDYSQFSGTDTGTAYSLEVVGESTFGTDSVYIERLLVTAPPFVSGQSGTLIENYRQTGLIYVRKSDQETVHDSLSKSMDFMAPGDSLGVHYREDLASVTRIAGNLPDSLKEGAAWKLSETHSQTIKWAYPDTAGIDSGTDMRTRLYVVKAEAPVNLKAGTFPAYEIDEADTGSSSSTQVWFSPEAKAIVREIDTSPDHADTTEISTLLLK